MFTDLFNRLLGEVPQPDPAQDYRQALSALLVRCARTDDDYAGREIATIDAVLAERYGLTATQAAALREEGERLEREAGDTVHLTKAIKGGVPYEERTAVVEALWRVALADNSRDYTENAFLRLVVSLLGVRDVDSGMARQAAEARR